MSGWAISPASTSTPRCFDMAVSTTTALLLGTLASAGLNAYNTQRTARKQDNALADSIRNQSRKQREADARVQQEVESLQGSTSADEREAALTDYTNQLRTNRAAMDSGLTGQAYGSDAFKERGQEASGKVGEYADKSAGLMARIDAPAYQRLGEGFSRGRLATDVGLLAREASGQSFLDELRLRAIRRNPWMDAAASFLQSGAGMFGGGGASAASIGQRLNTNASLPSPALPGPYASGYQYPTVPGYYKPPGWG